MTARALTKDEEQLILFAFQHRPGRYSAERAGQLSGIPARTLYDWSDAGVLVPDYVNARLKAWSYRDLGFARLLAWLRQQGHDRPDAAARVAALRDVMADVAQQFTEVRSDGSIVLLGEETVDRLTGQQMLDGMAQFLAVFSLLEPIAELGRKRLWGPDLLTPSTLTVISPWVMGGEPVVRSTRIPTASIHALRHDRGLATERIVALYPDLDAGEVDDAIALEDRLRRAA
jgi:uncharacterized protein (DUF433 family)/DNA-binding transcriptional MerR regulator